LQNKNEIYQLKNKENSKDIHCKIDHLNNIIFLSQFRLLTIDS